MDTGGVVVGGEGSTACEVPEWAIATGCSVVEGTQAVVAAVQSAAPQARAPDSHAGTGSVPLSSSHLAKSGKPSTFRFSPQILGGTSGSRSRPSSKAKVTEGNSDKANGGPLCLNGDSRSAHNKPSTGTPKPGESPINSMVPRQPSSVVPDFPATWQAVAGLRSGSTEDTQSSCCPGLLSSFDGGIDGKKRATPCTPAWWRALSHGLALEFKKLTQVVRSRPVVLLPGLAVLGVLLGLGLWALIAASESDTRFRHESALKIASDKAMYIQTELDKTFMPAYVVSTTVQQNPNYYPAQPSDLRVRYPNPWYLINTNFDKLSRDLIALTKAGSVRTVSAIPHGVIRTMYPLYGNTPTVDRNWAAVGKNWLNDSANAASVKTSLLSRNLTIIGPYNLTQGGIGIVGMQAIFVNASQDENFGIPPGPNNVTGPFSPIPGMVDLTWQPTHPDAPKFWGLVTVLISWDALRENVTRLQDLEDQGYDYVLTRPAGSDELAVAWSSGVDPPRPSGFNVTKDGLRPLIYYDLPKTLRDPVVVKVTLPNVEWTLYVTRADGWKPTWRNPLIAMVVIVSLVLSALVFAVLVSRLQQRRLFRDVVEAASQLAQTSRTLEEEKNRMQALLARHYDLIDLLEGGGGNLAASISGAPGADAAAGDGGARSRLDILRQKLLLTGTSLRREQLGEAEQITVQELLGEGTFGKVYKGTWRGTEVAIKTIVLPAGMSGKEKREKMAVMEAAISSSLAHPNIVQTYTYHIRPLRDSTAPTKLGGGPPPPSLAQSPQSTTGGGGGSPDANGTADSAAEGGAVGLLGQQAGTPTAAANAGRTQILANEGAIVVGSPESSVSTVMSMANGQPPPDASAAAAAAVAAAAGAVCGGAGGASPSGTRTPAPAPAPAALAGTAGGTGTAVDSGAAGPRGVSMDATSGQSGIHSYEVQLVLEYCDRGCLREALDAGIFFSQGGLNYPAILDTAADVAKALLHLHLNDVLHSDLKATNVMLKSTGEGGRGVIAKVADFGLSVRLDHTATHVSHAFQGSLTHMAPEVMLQGHVSRAADVYAFGVTMWEIFTGGHPYRGTPGALLGHQTASEGRRPVFPPGTPQGYRDLAERCWAHDANARPSFSQILETLQSMRTEIPGPTQPLAPAVPLAKRMAAAMAAGRGAAAAAASGGPGGAAAQGPAAGGGGAGYGGGAFGGSAGVGVVMAPAGGGGGSTGGSIGGSAVGMLHKLGGGSAAIQVGSRILSLSAAMQSADAMQSRGGLETITEEGSTHGGQHGAGGKGGACAAEEGAGGAGGDAGATAGGGNGHLTKLHTE